MYSVHCQEKAKLWCAGVIEMRGFICQKNCLVAFGYGPFGPLPAHKTSLTLFLMTNGSLCPQSTSILSKLGYQSQFRSEANVGPPYPLPLHLFPIDTVHWVYTTFKTLPVTRLCASRRWSSKTWYKVQCFSTEWEQIFKKGSSFKNPSQNS